MTKQTNYMLKWTSSSRPRLLKVSQFGSDRALWSNSPALQSTLCADLGLKSVWQISQWIPLEVRTLTLWVGPRESDDFPADRVLSQITPKPILNWSLRDIAINNVVNLCCSDCVHSSFSQLCRWCLQLLGAINSVQLDILCVKQSINRSFESMMARLPDVLSLYN